MKAKAKTKNAKIKAKKAGFFKKAKSLKFRTNFFKQVKSFFAKTIARK